MTNLARAGDGLLVALQMLALMQQASRPASKFFQCFSPSPQRLENLHDIDPQILKDPKLKADLKAIEADMNGTGRVLVRPSGTESLVRVMVEADSEAVMGRTIDALVSRIKLAGS